MARISCTGSITRRSTRHTLRCRKMIPRMACEVKLEFITTHLRSCVSLNQFLRTSNSYFIPFSGPYTEYKIVVVAITTRHDGNGSTPIIQRTDVSAPSPPIITNLACQKDGTILLRWKRPMIFFNTIDFYIVSYKSANWEYYRQFQINASADHIETEVR